jgi:hypothetical protein
MTKIEQTSLLRESIAFLQVAVAVGAIRYLEENAKLNEELAKSQRLLVAMELEDGEVE